jgi:hypothetical protein
MCFVVSRFIDIYLNIYIKRPKMTTDLVQTEYNIDKFYLNRYNASLA